MHNTFNITNSKTWKQIAGSQVATREINEIVERYSLKTIHVWAIKFLATSVKYGIDNVTQRFEEYYNMHPNERKGNTLKNCMLRYGIERGTAFYRDKNNRTKQTLENFIRIYGQVDGLARYKKCNSLKSGKKESFIMRHGEAEGLKRYKQFCEKNRGNHSIERKIEKGMSVDEAVRRVAATKEQMRKNTSLAGFIDKYGVEEGTRLCKERHKHFRFFSTTEGFKEKYGDSYKEMLRLCKDSHSREYYVRKYGEEEGQKRYDQHCNNIRYRQSLSYFIEKYGNDLGLIEFTKYRERGVLKSYSSVSQQLFDSIKQYASNNIYYATYNKEFLIISGNNCYYFDFVDNDTKRVIEFNGDIYHANPQIYGAQDRPNPYRKDLTSADIWELDKQKNQTIIQRGYELLVVWEKDYRTKYNDVIKECEDFLKYGRR